MTRARVARKMAPRADRALGPRPRPRRGGVAMASSAAVVVLALLSLARPGAAQAGYQSYVDSLGNGSNEHLLRCESFVV